MARARVNFFIFFHFLAFNVVNPLILVVDIIILKYKAMSKIIDLSYLNEVSGGDPDFEIELINTFIEQAPAFMDRLTLLLNEKKYPEMTPVAHKFKSSLTVFGMYTVYEKILKVETDTRAELNLDGLPALLDEIKVMVAEAGEELKNELKLREEQE